MGEREEPGLAVRQRPPPWFLRRRFLRPFAPAASLTVVGLVALLVFGSLISGGLSLRLLMLPFERVVMLEGATGSLAEFFEDDQVKALLLRHHMRVHATDVGSREVARLDLDKLDFAFLSGQPAADLVMKRRPGSSVYRPFTTPIVLATFREYAETLSAKEIAKPQVTAGSVLPLYYDLDMNSFLKEVRAGTSWEGLDGRAHGVDNRNRILAQTTDVCTSNGAAAYLALVSFAINDDVPVSREEASGFAVKIKPLLDQSLPPHDPDEKYFSTDGRSFAPIIVIYERQYLNHQLARSLGRAGKLDDERVLLYPRTALPTEPALVAFNDDAERLGDLLKADPDLRRREFELGFRVLPDPTNEQLSTFLAESGVPEPSPAGDTRASLPDLPLLERMITDVGHCEPVPG